MTITVADDTPDISIGESAKNNKSNLVTHAENEFNLVNKKEGIAAGQFDEFQKEVLQMVELFSTFGHSGASAPMAINLISTLLKFEPITPLTGEDDEWNDVSEFYKSIDEDSSNGVVKSNTDSSKCVKYQNKRDSRVFKNADGSCTQIDGKIFIYSDGISVTRHNMPNAEDNSEIKIESFPYTPKVEYIHLDYPSTQDE